MDQKKVVRLVLALIGIFGILYFAYQSWWYFREHSYDKEISSVATQYSVSPYLVKAVVWRESKFNRFCLGPTQDVGLMQITQGAVTEWATAQKLPAPGKTEWFNASTNLEIGSWYLARALQRWKDCDDPVPFALAEYNAGRSNVVKWRAKCKSPNSAREFAGNIGIASTRRYVQDVMVIQKKLERRGHL
ncbi:MAG: lytic transglycosylase domain-containing protein [Verrucomicrobiae bacterium]|nr:lytic transglycosylase domain-containing protein [Verrucomicrobiae bacterium]